MTHETKLNELLKNVPVVMYYEKDVEEYSLRDYRRQIQDIRSTIECEGDHPKWQSELRNAVHFGYEKYLETKQETELCYYCESEHTRIQSSYCCDGCEKAQEKEFDNN